MAWFLEFKWHGEDAYPLLREKFKDPAVYSAPDAQWDGPDIVRAEVFKTFGYYVTESSTIMAEFVPYFRKRNRPELFEKYKLRGVNSKATIQSQGERDKELGQQISGDFKFPTKRSGEYAIDSPCHRDRQTFADQCQCYEQRFDHQSSRGMLC